MIVFFPELYRDELIYSWIARYYVKSGHLTLTYALEDLYIHHYTKPDIEFLNELRPDALEVMEKHCSLERLIKEHTMFASYGRFLPKERRQKAYEALLAMHGNFNNLLAVPKNQRGTGRYLKYCPVCAKEDREKYGEAYWHRMHQIQGIRICPQHRCYLMESGISMERKASPGLWDAQSTIPEQEEVKLCNEEIKLAFTKYACQVFDSGIDLEGKISAADFLKWRLREYARTDSGASISLENLYEDYKRFYAEENIMSKVRMQKILSGSRWNFTDICQLAMFAGIPASELTKIPIESVRVFRNPVYVQVAEELQIDYKLVQRVGDAVLKHYESRERVQRRKRRTVWEQMDEELLPNVQAIVKKMYNTGQERPRRITVSAVRKEMGLPDKRFDKLPKCKAEILKHQESQKEYWAREIVWAVEKLMREKQVVNWRHVRELKNMRKIDFQNCKIYLRKYVEESEAVMIENII